MILVVGQAIAMKQNILLLLCTLYSATLFAQEPLYRMSAEKPRWATFENPKATVGARPTCRPMRR